MKLWPLFESVKVSVGAEGNLMIMVTQCFRFLMFVQTWCFYTGFSYLIRPVSSASEFR